MSGPDRYAEDKAKPEEPAVWVRIKARVSRTNRRTMEYIEVPAPRSEPAQIRQLEQIVDERFPGAELRVFDRGAASFTLDSMHIVAAYQGDTDPRPLSRSSEADGNGAKPSEQLRLTA